MLPPKRCFEGIGIGRRDGGNGMSLQRTGIEAVSVALDEMEAGGEAVTLILSMRPEVGSISADLAALIERATALGIPCEDGTPNDIWRMAVGTSPGSSPPEVLALVGRQPDGTLEEVFARGGLVWLLIGVRYAVNIGYSIRTAEVSGASAILIDSDVNHNERRTAIRASMRAHRFLPTLWVESAEAIHVAKAAGFRIIGIEDVGAVEPWDADLTGNILCIVGGERDGIPPKVIEECDQLVKLPMTGFVPSYNLQVATSVVALEALRQRRNH